MKIDRLSLGDAVSFTKAQAVSNGRHAGKDTVLIHGRGKYHVIREGDEHYAELISIGLRIEQIQTELV